MGVVRFPGAWTENRRFPSKLMGVAADGREGEGRRNPKFQMEG